MLRKKNFLTLLLCLFAIYSITSLVQVVAADKAGPLLNEPVDVSGDFRDFTNLYYLADKLANFDPATASGKITMAAGRVSYAPGVRSYGGWNQSGRSQRISRQ